MGTVTASDGIDIFYKDWGSGQPIVFSARLAAERRRLGHEDDVLFDRGYRVIAHDRRGHGRSTQAWRGHDMDTTRTISRLFTKAP